ncbi:MAG TPA: PEP-CTERM-box response regulator transcription factor [Verrucomicrobiae bacterium]
MSQRLLIIEDDEDIRSQMRWALAETYEVQIAADRSSGLDLFRAHSPEVVVLDLGLPPSPGDVTEGLATLSDILRLAPATKVIIASGQSDRTNALKAVGDGAYDFLPKPIDIDELKIVLKRAFYLAQLEKENRELANRVSASVFEGMLGGSRQMQDVFNSIRKVSATGAPVLILGESGTGKERVAQAIHNLGAQKAGPFVAINCGAIPENLLESELFGHEKGSFTGAHAQRVGKVETAEGGTLFLDEIGELPGPLQVKFLRFLQERVIQRVGGRKDIPINARVIAATNTDLKKAMVEGQFREDLYYRLAVVTLKLPPLREREGDVPLIAQSFLKRFATELGMDKKSFSSAALRHLEQYHWPGNVREMENRIRRAVIMSEGTRVTEADLELTLTDVPLAGRTLQEAREELDRQMVTQALRRLKGNISAAATQLGISRPTLYELMDKFGLRRAESDSSLTKV